ncbi:vomeronasal type-1 receptor 4-like [Suncus etruscus]|uniref:vomeronasal type-1 receptor 4-like n=1 Tax=Suncus etruscus TaxID=109475 RepID=UPI002110B90B|nr:vomeronasal type-1 receptor 4-like [Suncus etruscus]
MGRPASMSLMYNQGVIAACVDSPTPESARARTGAAAAQRQSRLPVIGDAVNAVSLQFLAGLKGPFMLPALPYQEMSLSGVSRKLILVASTDSVSSSIQRSSITMLPSEMTFRFFQISQICIGILGNSALFIFYSYTYCIQAPLKKPIDLIFMHLMLVNTLSMFKLIPEVMPSFSIRHFLDDLGCKMTVYTFRVIRGLPICTTMLLTLFQAVTISPSHSKWAWLKLRISGCIFPSLFFFWLINMVTYSHIIRAVGATGYNRSMPNAGYYQLNCQAISVDYSNSKVILSGMMLQELVFVVFMVGSSLYMVALLYRHHQRVRHVLSTHLSSPSYPEVRATQSIILLVSCFIFFYCLNNFLTFYILFNPDKVVELDQINGVLSSGYPTLCPIVLLRNTKIPFQFHKSMLMVRAAFGKKTRSRRWE